MTLRNLNQELSSDESPKRQGCLKKALLTGVVGVLLLFACWQLLEYGIDLMLYGNNPYQIPTPFYPLATITTRQVDEKLVVSLPGNAVTIEMVYVPEGVFAMGSEEETPIHDVYLDAFWIDRTEVTNAQFAAFVNATGYQTAPEQEGRSNVFGGNSELVIGANWYHPQGPDSTIEGMADHPVVQVSWYDAVAYCQWRGAWLPTEAEWEKAARGMDDRIYPWGNEITGAELNYCDAACAFYKNLLEVDDGYATTAPVGSFPHGDSFYGVADMAGNVMEYTADWYASYPDSFVRNPTGPATEGIEAPNPLNHWAGGLKVIRGGSWIHGYPHSFAMDFRNTASLVGGGVDYVGFRCASTP